MTNETYAKLLRAIREHADLELSNIRDAGRYGADSGFAGFTYYTDTIEFYDNNESLIWDLIEEDSDEFGQTPLEFISGFGGSAHVGDLTGFKNLLSWYALESAGRRLEDRREERSFR